MAELDADYDAVIWVTSAYLLGLRGAAADHRPPRRPVRAEEPLPGRPDGVHAASLWCGLAGTIEMLIAARVVQGIGAALITPQTMSIITRIFPPSAAAWR